MCSTPPSAYTAYLVCCCGEPALLVQQVQHSQPALNEVQHVLVVHKLDVAPVNLLTLILSLKHKHSVHGQMQLTGAYR
jgi:hypothetical protein